MPLATDVTATEFDDHGKPAWQVTGPNGTVTYRLLGNHLYLDPATGAAFSAPTGILEGLRGYAEAGDSSEVWKVLRRWYEQMPAAGVGVPATVEQWRQLRGPDLVKAMLSARWYARPDDLIGGWCVMPCDLPPSSGAPEVGGFMCEEHARHVADLHNQALRRNA
jgi:hypothetical protein